MKTKTEKILAVMKVLSWMAFIGLGLGALVIFITWCFGIFSPDTLWKLKADFNLVAVHGYGLWYFTTTLSFFFALAVLKAYIALLVIRVLSKINLANPFTIDVTQLLERISYTYFGTWVIVMLFNTYASWLAKRIPDLGIDHMSSEFILLAGVVFIISQVFKRGIELQSENELTV